jgi:hypothetical protein
MLLPLLWESSAYSSHILLLHFLICKLQSEQFGRLARKGQNHQAGRESVQAVDSWSSATSWRSLRTVAMYPVVTL